MEKAFEQGAAIRRKHEARKAANPGRGGRPPGSKNLATAARAAVAGARAASGSGKLPGWTLMAGPVPAAAPAPERAAPSIAAQDFAPAPAGQASLPPGDSLGGSSSMDTADTGQTGQPPPVDWQPKQRRVHRKKPPQPRGPPGQPRVPLLQSGLGILPTLLPRAAPRPAAPQSRPPPQVAAGAGAVAAAAGAGFAPAQAPTGAAVSPFSLVSPVQVRLAPRSPADHQARSADLQPLAATRFTCAARPLRPQLTQFTNLSQRLTLALSGAR